ncbi:MAG: hypothetical protein ACI4LK_09015 [Lentihominibacter sp.]
MPAGNEVGGKFTIDISDLKAGITEANRLMKLADSEFKAAAAGMGDWSKSADGLTAKATQLNKAIDIQQTKIDALEEEYQRVVEAQGENSAAAQNLRIRINNETAAREKNKKSLDDVNKALNDLEAESKQAANATDELADSEKKAGKAAKDAEKDTDSLGSKMKSLAGGGVKLLAGALAGLATSFFASAEATREYRTEMGKLEAAFTTAGHSTEAAKKTYEELYAFMGEEDTAVEAANHLAKLTDNTKDLDKWTNICTGVFATFGDSLPIEGLTEAANETAKVGQVTGPLADALNWAGVSEDEFNEALAKCTSEQERQALITDTLNGLYTDASNKYKEINKDVMDANKAQSNLNDAMAKVGEMAEPVMTKLKNLGAEALNAFTGMFSGFSDVIKGDLSLGDWGNQLVTDLKASITNNLPKLMAAGGDMLRNLGNGLKQNLPVFISNVLDLFMSFADTVKKNAPQLISSGMEFIRNLVKGIMDSLPILISKVPTIVSKIATTISSAMPVILAKGVQIIGTIVLGLIKAIPTLIANIPKIIKAIVDVMMAYGWGKLGGNIIKGLGNGIKSMAGFVKTAAVKIKDTVVNAIKTLPSKLLKMGKEAISKLASALKSTGGIKGAVSKIKNAVINGLKSIPGSVKSIGTNIVKGLWNGINNAKEWVLGKIKGFGKGILNGLKDFFGIKSPSRVMRDQVGKYLAQGIGVGFTDNIGAVMKNVNAAINPNLDISGSVKGTAAAAAGTVINFTQNNNSPKALSPYEVYRQTKIATKLVTVR